RATGGPTSVEISQGRDSSQKQHHTHSKDHLKSSLISNSIARMAVNDTSLTGSAQTYSVCRACLRVSMARDRADLRTRRWVVRIGVLVLLVGCAMGCVLPLAAHHSFAAEFDDKQPVKLDGTVVKFDFMNPHSWIYLDAKSPDGAVVRWSVETGSTNALFRRGSRKESLRPGDHITIDAFRAKDGSNTANA